MLNKAWITSNAKGEKTQIQDKDIPSNSRVSEKSKEQQWAQLWVLHLFAHQPLSSQRSSLVPEPATKKLT